MTEIDVNTTEQTDGEGSEKEYSGRKIMCFVSKRMVPIEDTVEVEYSPGKSYRVLEKFVRYQA